jgi:type VI secretion system protein ImpC
MAEEMKKEKEAKAAEAVAIEPSEFDKLLKKEFKPKTDHAREAIGSAVRTLAEPDYA